MADKRQTGIPDDKSPAPVGQAFRVAAVWSVGLGALVTLLSLALYGLTDFRPTGSEAEAYWSAGRANLPLSVFISSLVPCLLFAALAFALSRWQRSVWPISLGVIGLIMPQVWLHGTVFLDIFTLDGAYAAGLLYLPPYPILQISLAGAAIGVALGFAVAWLGRKLSD